MTWEPTASVEIIAGTPPGGGQDRAARALAAALDLATSVTNTPGRGGGNGWDELAARHGDSHVVSISSPTIITNRILGVASIDDTHLTPLAHLCTEYLAFAVASESPISGPLQLAEALCARIAVALATARGNINHMAVGMVSRHAGAAPSSVPVRVFDSARYAVADMLAGNADVAVVSAASVIPELEAGVLRVVATSSDSRLASPFAFVPTWEEVGVDCTIGTWRGVIGPAGLEHEQIEFWDRAVASAVVTGSWMSSLAAHRWASTHLDAEATRHFLSAERLKLSGALSDLELIDG